MGPAGLLVAAQPDGSASDVAPVLRRVASGACPAATCTISVVCRPPMSASAATREAILSVTDASSRRLGPPATARLPTGCHAPAGRGARAAPGAPASGRQTGGQGRRKKRSADREPHRERLLLFVRADGRRGSKAEPGKVAARGAGGVSLSDRGAAGLQDVAAVREEGILSDHGAGFGDG
jgi:hypothetical protein